MLFLNIQLSDQGSKNSSIPPQTTNPVLNSPRVRKPTYALGSGLEESAKQIRNREPWPLSIKIRRAPGFGNRAHFWTRFRVLRFFSYHDFQTRVRRMRQSGPKLRTLFGVCLGFRNRPMLLDQGSKNQLKQSQTANPGRSPFKFAEHQGSEIVPHF